MEVDYRLDEMRRQRDDEWWASDDGERLAFGEGWRRAVETVYPDLAKIDKLRQALAAAEAECAASRKSWDYSGPAHLEARRSNDAMRERLGLGKIGEAR